MNSDLLNEQKSKYGSFCIGNVIRIIGKQTLLVNAGKNSLNVGDTIQVYELGEKIYDIDGSELCPFVFVKDQLQVIQTEEDYSICKKTETKSISFTLSPLLNTETYVPLKIDEGDIQALHPNEPKIKIGDPIKLA